MSLYSHRSNIELEATPTNDIFMTNYDERWIEEDEEKRSRFQLCKAGIKQIFAKRERTKQHNNLLWYLQTRAWAFDIIFTVTRIFMKVMGQGIYEMPCIIGDESSNPSELVVDADITSDSSHVCINYNIEMMRPSITVIDGMVWFLLFFALLLDILCFKYRYLGNGFIYIHIVHMVLTRMLPNPETDSYGTQPIQFGFAYVALF